MHQLTHPDRWRTLPALVLALAWMNLPTVLVADEPPLITDRPDQTESAFTIPRGLIQIEGGWSYGEFDEPESDTTVQAFPQALLRIGLNDRFELRLGVPGIEIEQTDSSTGTTETSGLVDATVGFKVVVAEENGALPQAAFLGTLVVPSGDRELRSERIDPAFRFALSHTLSERFSLGYNLGMVWLSTLDEPSDTVETQSLFDWTLALGYGATERLGLFVEAFGLAPVDADLGTATTLDAGLTYLLTPRLQLDASVAYGVSSAARDGSVGLGVSYRFPRSRK